MAGQNSPGANPGAALIENTNPTTPNGWVHQVVIRTAAAGDLTALEWDGEYTHYRRMYADAYRRSLQGRSILWVAELPGVGIIGQTFVQLLCDRPELADGSCRAYMYAFRVKPTYRGKGVGSMIIQTMEADLRRRRYMLVTLNVARDNISARRLYERMGYQVVAPEPGIWSYQDHLGEWHTVEEPAWRMEKNL
jgi:ribosomal protein S18 acetylase RimI-like enzyme